MQSKDKKPLKITKLAKATAKNAISIRKKLLDSKKVGLSKTQAKRLGVFLGLKYANYLINHTHMPRKVAMKYYQYYQTVKNCKTFRCEQAIKLFGGRRFLRDTVLPYIKRVN